MTGQVISVHAEQHRGFPRAFLWLLVFSSFFAFLGSPYLRDFSAAGFDPSQYFLYNDFENFWAAARIAIAHDLPALFDSSKFMNYLPKPEEGFTWSYPLHCLMILYPLGFLSYPAALIIWNISGLGIYLLTAWKYIQQHKNFTVLFLLVISPASIISLILGQFGFFTAALYLGGFYLISRKKPGQNKPVWAGILFGILTIKPQLGLLIPFILIALKQKKVFLWAAISAVFIIGLSVLLWGIEPSLQYYTANGAGLFLTNMAPQDQPGAYWSASVYAGLINGGVSTAIAMIIQLLCLVICGALAVARMHKDGLNRETLLLATLAGLLATPYLHSYDLTVLAGAIVIYLCGYRLPQNIYLIIGDFIVFGLLWALPLLTWLFKTAEIPASPVIMIAGFAWIYYRRSDTLHKEF